MLIPSTWTADTYLGRAESGRSRPLRLSCYPESGDEQSRAEFFVKTVGLPEIIEQHLFAEMLGNVVAREFGMRTPEPSFIELTSEFAGLVRESCGIRAQPGLAVGGRSLGASLSPPVFGRMASDQRAQAARIYLFDMVVENPDRRRTNGNCAVVGGALTAYDFADSFSFLLPVIGGAPESWVVPTGISSQHLFRGTLDRALPDWPALFESLRGCLEATLEDPMSWMPGSWSEWLERVRAHFAAIVEHFDEFRFEVLRSL